MTLDSAGSSWQTDATGEYSSPDPPPPNEQEVVLAVFTEMLKAATRDGGRKRAAGIKPPWWRDTSHEPALFSHLNKWKHGELVDKDSGAHPLVNLAWRALAIAHQETHGMIDPGDKSVTPAT